MAILFLLIEVKWAPEPVMPLSMLKQVQKFNIMFCVTTTDCLLSSSELPDLWLLYVSRSLLYVSF